ncbi:hypothetical protein H4R33_000134 [Dimargaris cristalligena]|uniref:Galactose oxidase n=1 Tax=Dimargaris cristalligena TaxID=215637 RepID=A0A4V1J5U3_9FUNG|nr:hypothetical protein H4R33_000134 [Dimargaris cristalligena]RKP40259.1 hypothetical protein BJ085DRAFT_32305 [Dimargaris cristalligena]|eukprot:RKP40259.1 hypothetical protein BJ085DRAFT_32305 [Dimargaris cristalligena]
MRLILILGLLALFFPALEAASSLGNPISPPWRGFHCAAVAGSSANRYIMIHGGISDSKASTPLDSPASSELFLFDLEHSNWFQPSIEGGLDVPQKLHPCAPNDDRSQVFVYTPVLADNESSHLQVLDTSHWTWSNPAQSGPAPTSRQGPSFSPAPSGSMFFFGGRPVDASGNPDTSSISTDLSVLDTSSLAWTSKANGNGLMFHSACYLSETDSIIVFGGASQDALSFANVRTYSLTAQTWDVNPTIDNASSGPSPRAFHSAACLSNQMIVFGGTDAYTSTKPTDSTVWILTGTSSNGRATYKWSQAPITDKTKGPSARFGHSALLQDDKMYVYGGVGTGGDTNMYVLDTQAWSWNVVSISGNGGSSESGSNTTTVLIASIVSGVFAILAMGIIAAVGVRNWRRRKGKQGPTDDDGVASGDAKTCSDRGPDKDDGGTQLSVLPSHSRGSSKDSSDSDADSGHLRSYGDLTYDQRLSLAPNQLDDPRGSAYAALVGPGSVSGVAPPPPAASTTHRPRLYSTNSDYLLDSPMHPQVLPGGSQPRTPVESSVDQWLPHPSAASRHRRDSIASNIPSPIAPIRYIPSPPAILIGRSFDSDRPLSLVSPDGIPYPTLVSPTLSPSSPHPDDHHLHLDVPIARPITPPAPPRLNTLFANFQPMSSSDNDSTPNSPNPRMRSYHTIGSNSVDFDQQRRRVSSRLIQVAQTDGDAFISPLDKIARLQLDDLIAEPAHQNSGGGGGDGSSGSRTPSTTLTPSTARTQFGGDESYFFTQLRRSSTVSRPSSTLGLGRWDVEEKMDLKDGGFELDKDVRAFVV